MSVQYTKPPTGATPLQALSERLGQFPGRTLFLVAATVALLALAWPVWQPQRNVGPQYLASAWAAGITAALVVYLIRQSWSQATQASWWRMLQALMLFALQWASFSESPQSPSVYSSLPLYIWAALFLVVHAFSLTSEYPNSGQPTASAVQRLHHCALAIAFFALLILGQLGQEFLACVGGYISLLASHLHMMRRDTTRPEKVNTTAATWLSSLGCALLMQGGMLNSVPSNESLPTVINIATLLFWGWYIIATDEWRASKLLERQRQEETLIDQLEEQVQRERTEVKARIARDNAQIAIERQKEFLATMSHELRTPLSCVVGLSRLLAANEEFGASLRKDMGTIERLSVQLLRTVDDGLSYIRQEKTQHHPSTRRVHMGHLLRDIKSLANWLARQQRNELRFLQVKNIPAQLYFDEQKVRQLLINLISNAARYCQDGVIILGVTLRETPGQRHLEWLVEDSGRGMDAQEQQHFFEPFAKSRDSQGLGLGLALVKRLVHELGGHIQLHSEKQKGTSVRVSIPVQTEGNPDTQPNLDDEEDPHHPQEPVSQPMALLPHTDLELLNLAKLKKLIKLGQLSEVEAWLAHAKGLQGLGPESHNLLQKIEAALSVVDLAEIQALIDEVDTPLSFV